MIVEEFDTKKGLYCFELEDFTTDFHSHPALEIIEAIEGSFELSTEETRHSNLKFAIVMSNCKHQLQARNAKIRLTMIEHHQKFFAESIQAYLPQHSNHLISTNPFSTPSIITTIIQNIREKDGLEEYDARVAKVIDHLNSNDLESSSKFSELTKITHLSESRLSHLFSKTIGISLRKYLIWNKLKKTIKEHLSEKEDLFTALLHNGFYDQPHFTRNFKSMLGISPSKAYNSRNVQVLK